MEIAKIIKIGGVCAHNLMENATKGKDGSLDELEFIGIIFCFLMLMYGFFYIDTNKHWATNTCLILFGMWGGYSLFHMFELEFKSRNL
jgi:hypothetical protein